MELPKVFIWRPKKEIDVPQNDDDVGHVALKTDKYYVSIWPARYLKDGKLFIRSMDAIYFMNGVNGSLVLNINVDREREGDCDPDEYEIHATAVTNEDLNPIIEEFLLYNKINPENVTLAKGEDLFLKRQEYDKLSREQAEKVEVPEKPTKSLSKTEYSISAELLSGKEVAEPFYHKQQSCVSLVFNLLQVAWLKHHPDQPIPVPDIIGGLSAYNHVELFHRVMWFDGVVQKYFISKSNKTGQSTEEPGMPLIINIMNEAYFRLNMFLLVFFALAIFSCFYPFWSFRGYPVFFGLCVLIVYPFPMIHFVVGLFFMLSSYIYPGLDLPFILITIVYMFYTYATVVFVRIYDESNRLKNKLIFEMFLNMARNLVANLVEKLGM